MTTEFPTTGRPASDDAAKPRYSDDSRKDVSRIDWLFRDALRQRQVHPLLELVRLYRKGAAS